MEVVLLNDKLNSLEQHILQLINMVAENNKIVKETNNRMDRLEQRMDNQEKKFDIEKQLNAARHVELIKEIRSNSIDIDYLRNEISKHDLEINKIKTLTSS